MQIRAYGKYQNIQWVKKKLTVNKKPSLLKTFCFVLYHLNLIF